jgi:hypothetical protein
MSTTSRTVPKGGQKDGESGDAQKAASEPKQQSKVDPAGAKGAPAPAVVVSRVLNVSSPYSQAGSPRSQRGGKPEEKPPPPKPAAAPQPPRQQTLGGITLPEEEPATERRRDPISKRPSAPEMAAVGSEDSHSIADTFEKLLSDVDAHFDAMIEPDGPVASRAPREGKPLDARDLEDVRQLFAQLASKHMRQVRDFMLDLKWGEAPSTWIAVCEPAVRSLRGASERLDLTELCIALDDFGAALELAGQVEQKSIAGEVREQLLASYDELSRVMPDAFSLEMDKTQRESVIVHSLLLQIPGVRKVTIERLYAAGLSSLETLFAASSAAIVETTGVGKDIAELIVERFLRYRGELQTSTPDATHAQERERMAGLVKRLKSEHAEFEAASAGWSADAVAKKKTAREARAATLLEVSVLLARLGEVERVHTIERLPFDKKLEALEAYLDEAELAYMHGT